jgi:hypothetical protein
VKAGKGRIHLFVAVAVAWALVGALVAGFLGQPGRRGLSVFWFLGIWAASFLDLVVLAKAVLATMDLVSANPGKRGALIIRAFYWGILKLACLGIFAALLIRGQPIPAPSMFFGAGTMVIVPLVGGALWSSKELREKAV